MAPTLYVTAASPPARAVLVFAKAIGLDLNIKSVDLTAGEHTTPDYLKINPQHTVPLLVDDDAFAVWESHAIIPYLHAKYAKNKDLYPEDLQKRAVINHRLHYDTGVAFATLREVLFPLLHQKKERVTDEDRESLANIYGFLEAFLGENAWIAGKSLTIADYSLLTTVSSMNVVEPVDASKFPKVAAWLKKGLCLPEFDVNKQGLIIFKTLVRNFL